MKHRHKLYPTVTLPTSDSATILLTNSRDLRDRQSATTSLHTEQRTELDTSV
ncbi:hypothetical protein YC2023_060221 [Brassica napus]